MELNGHTIGRSDIAYEILAYLSENPDAKDTLEGVVEWWLLKQKVERETMKVKEALAELISKGLVLERKGRDSRAYYRINRRKLGEIQALLKGRPK